MNIVEWEKLTKSQRDTLLQRPAQQNSEIVLKQVREIIEKIRSKGDAACFELTEKYDGARLKSLAITAEQINAARVSPAVISALELAKNNIVRMQSALLPQDITVETCAGVICQRLVQPIDAVGLYVPAGTAPLVSTLMMIALPAKIAACPQIILCTPPNKSGEINPAILYAAKLCGISQIFAIGGAQAIAAMAYGTETIPKVSKIFGPGNAWVTAAKQLVAQDPLGAACDLPAGPSEIMVIADETADSTRVAADLLSQAEHASDAQVMLCTNSLRVAREINQAINDQLQNLPRKQMAQAVLANSRTLLVSNLAEAIDIANNYAPEHLSLQCENPERWINCLRNCGTVFIGENTAESFGDYVTGSNHVLPTYGYARCYSGLSVADFMRYMTIQTLTQEAVSNLAQATITLAELEGLTAHANAVRCRVIMRESV